MNFITGRKALLRFRDMGVGACLMHKEKQEGRTGENTWFLEKSKYSHLTGMQGSNAGVDKKKEKPLHYHFLTLYLGIGY